MKPTDNNNRNTNPPDTEDLADHQYSRRDYEGHTQVEQGIAETHEMVSDVYMTGNNPVEPDNG